MRIWLCVFVCVHSLFATAYRGEKAQHAKIREYYRQTKRNDWWNGYCLLRDGPLKEKLAQAGITTLSSFATDMVGNPVGGKARGFGYAGSYGLSVDINFDNTRWKGLEIFSSAVWRTGTSLSQRKIDNQFPVQQVFGSQTVKLNELYLEQTLCNGNFVMKAGRLDGGNDFLVSPLYWYFVNNAFNGNPISIFFNVPFVAYPNPTWGAFLMFKPYKRLSAQFACYNANTYINQNKYHGVNFTFKSTNGVLWMTEWCALVNQEPEDRGMPGNYKVGAYYLTGDVSKFTGGQERGDPGYYFLFDQMVYRWGAKELGRGITPFVCFVMAPQNRNLFPFFFNCGVVCQGIVPNRPKDSLNLGYVYGKYSSVQASVQERSGLTAQNFETILEANYWIQINPWFYITPDVQYVIHPKGLHTPNALVFGVQIGVTIW